MRLIFINRASPVSYAICALTAAGWAHVGIEVNGRLYEAKAGTGVRTVAREAFFASVVKIGRARVDCNDDAAEEFLRAQLGKPYDWSAIFSWFGSRDWQEDDKWFCFELAAAAAAAGGKKLVYAETSRVTGALWNSPAIVREPQ